MKKSKILLYIMILMIIGLIGYLIFNYVTNYTNNIINTNNVIENNIDYDDDSSYYSANYEGYSYILPDETFYKLQSGEDGKSILNIYNNSDKWGAIIRVIDKSKYDKDLFINYDKLEEMLKNDGKNRVENKKEFNENNKSVVSYEVYDDKTGGLYAYMPAYDNYEYGIILFNSDEKTINYDALDMVIEILNNGRKIEE